MLGDRGDSAEVRGVIGSNLRSLRQVRGVTQEALGVELGLTFQQVQKYERGSNRISAERLYLLARILDCPVGAFFRGLPGYSLSDDDLAGRPEGDRTGVEVLNLVRLWPHVPEAERRFLLDEARKAVRMAREQREGR